jgi:hypothetical protein
MTRDENAMRDKLELGVLVLGIRKRERLGLLDGYGGDTVLMVVPSIAAKVDSSSSSSPLSPSRAAPIPAAPAAKPARPPATIFVDPPLFCSVDG